MISIPRCVAFVVVTFFMFPAFGDCTMIKTLFNIVKLAVAYWDLRDCMIVVHPAHKKDLTRTPIFAASECPELSAGTSQAHELAHRLGAG